MVPTHLAENEIFVLQQEIDRQRKLNAVDMERLCDEYRRLIIERDKLSKVNDCLARNNELLSKEVTLLKMEIRKRPPLDKHETVHNKKIKIIEDERDKALEENIKMKTEIVPELKRQILKLTRQGRSSSSLQR